MQARAYFSRSAHRTCKESAAEPRVRHLSNAKEVTAAEDVIRQESEALNFLFDYSQSFKAEENIKRLENTCTTTTHTQIFTPALEDRRRKTKGSRGATKVDVEKTANYT